MRVIYLLLSPTLGMHQYTADLANRVAAAGHDVHLVTTACAPRAPYCPQLQIHTPIAGRSTGFTLEGLNLRAMRRVLHTLEGLSSSPCLVHLTGVHLWNPLLVRWLRRQGLPTVHSLHDLDPHLGVRFGRLIHLWNRAVIAGADHVLVHGQVYRQRIIQQGVPANRVTYTPLLHLFLSHAGFAASAACDVQWQPWALFFGRLERYKGIAQLLSAVARVPSSFPHHCRLILAGPGPLAELTKERIPSQVEVRNYLIDDKEGMDLFSRCGLLVLPYLDATQSALIASAYYFQKPVVVTSAGALAEYVAEGQTGWIVPAGDVAALADCLQEALSDTPRLRRMGSAGRDWYDHQRTLEWETLLAMYHIVIEFNQRSAS